MASTTRKSGHTMPFMTSATDATLPQPVLKQVDIKNFQLLTPFRYHHPDTGIDYDVPAQSGDAMLPGHHTDLASVPSLLWGLCAPYGRQTLPALLHDHLCDDTIGQPKDEALRRRNVADAAFRVALDEQGVPAIRRWLMFVAVRMQAFWKFSKPRLAGYAAAIVAVAAATVWATGWLAHGWARPLPALVATAVATKWPHRFAIPVLGAYAGPLAIVVGLVVAAASLMVWLPDLVRYEIWGRFHGWRPPVYGATAMRRALA
jgi:hypothetical protein